MSRRKKIRHFLRFFELCSVAIVLSFCMGCFYKCTVYAESATENVYEGFTYKVNGNDTITIIDYIGEEEVVFVPSEIDGKTVSALGGTCFNYNDIVKEITFPDTINGYSGGYSCKNLEKITINAYKQTESGIGSFSYGHGMFADCPKLKTIIVNENDTFKTLYAKDNILYLHDEDVDMLVLYPGGKTDKTYTFEESLRIGAQAFEGNKYIEKVIFSKPLKDHYTYNSETGKSDKVMDTNSVFRWCTNLKEVEFTGLTEISAWFWGCINLEKINIPNTVTKIGSMMFHECWSLKELEIPASVKFISNTLCQDCMKLEKCVVYSDDVAYETDSKGVPFDGVWNNCDNVVLYCNEGSTTEAYAKMFGLKYKLLNEKETVPVTAITLSRKSLEIIKGDYTTLKATVKPKNADNSMVIWKSSDTKVATVNQNGKVTGKGSGKATITATAEDGSGVKASCNITVVNKITYKLYGGKNNKGNPSTYYNEKIVLKSPTRKGYSFKGWYTDNKFINKITTIKKSAKQNYTLYAKWEKVSLKKNSISSAKNKEGRQIALKYKKTVGAEGYEIAYSTDKKFQKSVKKATSKKTTYTIKKLKKGKTYYVKVRAYKQDSTGKKVYSGYSKVIKVEIKK